MSPGEYLWMLWQVEQMAKEMNGRKRKNGA